MPSGPRQHSSKDDAQPQVRDASAVRSINAAPDAVAQSFIRNHFSRWWPVWVAWFCSRLGIIAIGVMTERTAIAEKLEHIQFLHLGVYGHYVDVVQNGYTLKNATEFPLLPMVMWGINALNFPLAIGTFIFGNIVALIGLLCVAKLGERFVDYNSAVRAAIYMAIFPTAWAFSMASTEGVLLACMGGAALLALRGTAWSWGGAALLAFGCGLTRPPGVLVSAMLLGIFIMQYRSEILNKARTFAAIIAMAAAPAAAFSFFLFLKYQTGDFFASLHAQKNFGRSISITGPYNAVEGAFTSLRAGFAGPMFELIAALVAAAFVIYFFLKAVGSRWEITGWTMFALGSLMLPISTGTVWQMPRFVLVIPPLFWMIGRFGRRSWFHTGVLVLFPMALAYMLVFEIVGDVR